MVTFTNRWARVRADFPSLATVRGGVSLNNLVRGGKLRMIGTVHDTVVTCANGHKQPEDHGKNL